MVNKPITVIEQFSDLQKEQIIAWYKAGQTQQSIAEKCNVSRRTIMKLLKQLEQTLDISLKKSNSEVQKSLPPEEIQVIIDLRSQGRTFAEIAKTTGKSLSAIARICKKRGIGGNTKHKHIAAIDIDKLYIDYQNMDMEKLEAKYSISSSTIYDKLHKANKFIDDPIRVYDGSKNGKPRVDAETIIEAYEKHGSMSKVANEIGYCIQGVKNVLSKSGVEIRSTSEIMTADGNPFYGKQHDEITKQECIKIGSEFGKKFWIDNPDYVEIVRSKNKEYWKDIERRKEDSRRISLLRAEGKCANKRGVLQTRFGPLSFDSSYEASVIEYCESDNRIVDVERDFALIEYDYDGSRHYIPDFRIWLSNGDYLVVETKSEWFAKQPKEREKIRAGFIEFAEKYMVLDKDVTALKKRIDIVFQPENFEFSDVVLADVAVNDYVQFYSLYHYMGKTGRRGPTYGAYLHDRLIACATISSITRNETARRHKLAVGEIRELVRFCIHPEFHKKNFGSWFLARVLENYKKIQPVVKMVVSFADTGSHTGTLYLASNWTYDGDTQESYHYENNQGEIIHKRTIWAQATAQGKSESVYASENGLRRVKEHKKKRYYYSLG